VTRIVIFAKAPVPGRVKTRLIPALGAKGAAKLAAEMLKQTLQEARAARLGVVELCADPCPDDPAWDCYREVPDLISDQGQGELGERLARAAGRAIEAGERVILIGTDCPDLDRNHLRNAAAALDEYDVVIHPAIDGGYVLLGLARFDPSLFSNIPWSSEAVANETLGRIARLGWSLLVGVPLRDIDEPADLP
jgi:hypothetical protein